MMTVEDVAAGLVFGDDDPILDFQIFCGLKSRGKTHGITHDNTYGMFHEAGNSAASTGRREEITRSSSQKCERYWKDMGVSEEKVSRVYP